MSILCNFEQKQTRYLSTNEDRVKTTEIFTIDTPIHRSVFTTVSVIFRPHRQKIRQKLECVAKPSLMAAWVRWIETSVLFLSFCTVYGPKFTELSTHVPEYMQFATLEYVCLVYICIFTFLKIDYILNTIFFIVRLCVCHLYILKLKSYLT